MGLKEKLDNFVKTKKKETDAKKPPNFKVLSKPRRLSKYFEIESPSLKLRGRRGKPSK